MEKKYNILIAEDEKINLFLLQKLIEKSKFPYAKITHANSGKEAVELCNDNFDLILMDVEMPAMNGFEACAEIKSKQPNMPIIMQTAHCTESHKEQAVQVGCDGFLSKPIIRKDLDDLLEKYAPKV